jgi:hypothetical protein
VVPTLGLNLPGFGPHEVEDISVGGVIQIPSCLTKVIPQFVLRPVAAVGGRVGSSEAVPMHVP